MKKQGRHLCLQHPFLMGSMVNSYRSSESEMVIIFGEQLSEQWSGSKLPAWAWQKFQLDGEQRHSTVTARLRPHKEVVILKRRRQVHRRSNPVHYQLWRLKIHEGFSMTSSYVL
uniref:Uncharacterized protein n=1 Tax=Populus alba TaxID=43335 RepID=A0A4U5NKJ7_POPAL|nr:hypothetical protein D5086_0000261100 [Populus alba]